MSKKKSWGPLRLTGYESEEEQAILNLYMCGYNDCDFTTKYPSNLKRHRNAKNHFVEVVGGSASNEPEPDPELESDEPVPDQGPVHFQHS